MRCSHVIRLLSVKRGSYFSLNSQGPRVKSLKISTHKASNYPLPAFTSTVHTESKLLKKL